MAITPRNFWIVGAILIAIGVIGQLLSGSKWVLYLSVFVLWLGLVGWVLAARGSNSKRPVPHVPAVPDPALLFFRRLCLIGAPVVLFGIEVFHPAGFTSRPGAFAYLSHHGGAYFGPHWWFLLHMIQTPMIGLVSAGLMLRVSGLMGFWPWLARAAALVFLVYYTVLDSIGGVVVGWLLRNESTFSEQQGSTPKEIVNTLWTDPVIGGVGSLVSQTGSWAVLVATVAVAISLAWTRTALWPLILLVLAGSLIEISHARPTGPLGFAMLGIAAGAVEIIDGSRSRRGV